jgi:hypothetical protein
MHFGELGCESFNWAHVAQDRDWWRVIVNTVMR